MEKTTLGSGGASISPMGIGTWSWGDRLFWGYGKDHSEEDVQAAFDVSLAAGINFYDTAEIYGSGESERILGRLIRAVGEPVVVGTKLMPFPWRLGRATLRNALRRSLARLGTDRVDLYQMHWPNPPVPIESWMAAMLEVVDQGLVGSVGVSNYDVRQTERAQAALASGGVHLASNQVRFNLLDRGPERSGLLQLCRDLGVTLIAYSPLAQGLLSGKYTPETPPPGIRGMGVSRKRLAQTGILVERLRAMGQAHGGKTPAQVALNWLMAKGAVPIPGAKNARQASENAGAMGWELTAGEILELEEVSDRLGTAT
jgi:aryl-alcohol dehydrogenase-like predicted oxidoreductase